MADPASRSISDELVQRVSVPAGMSSDQAEIFKAGVRATPLFAGLVLRAVEEARARNVSRIWYFTREGTFFSRVHEVLARSLTESAGPLPDASILEVSRLSTFAASLRELTPSEFRRVWSVYVTQSMDALCTTVGIDPLSAAPMFAAAGLDPSDPINEPWKDRRVQTLFENAAFVDLLRLNRDRRRTSLLAYLRHKGFLDDGSQKLIVDIGWRGTIQDNLAYLRPGSHITGIYLAMHQLLNDQPANCTKIAYAANVATDYDRCARLLQHVQPLEMLCNAPEGSVTGYQLGTTSREPVATRTRGDEDATSYERCAKQFQSGVLAAAPALVAVAPAPGWTSLLLHPAAFDAMARLIADPPLPMARAFFELRHNEVFGMGRTIDMGRSGPTAQPAPPKNDAERAALERAADASNWPCAYLRVHQLEAERIRFMTEHLRISPQV